MRLRDRLRAARYGPRAPGDAAQLASELEQVLRVLDGDPARTGRRGRDGRVVAVALLAAALARPAAAQALSAEALYEAGAPRAAADSLPARAPAQPRAPAPLYNPGATPDRARAGRKAIA